MPSKPTLRRMLRERIAAAIQSDSSGAEVKNLCDALYTLEGRGQGTGDSTARPRPLRVIFEGDADEYSR